MQATGTKTAGGTNGNSNLSLTRWTRGSPQFNEERLWVVQQLANTTQPISNQLHGCATNTNGSNIKVYLCIWVAAAPPSEDGIQNETNFRAAQRMGKVELTIHSTWHTKLLSIQEIGRSSTEILWKPQVTTVANDKNNNGNNGNNNNNTQHRSEKHFWGGKTQKRRFLTFKQTLDQCGTWPTPPSSVAHCGCGSRVLGGYKKIIDARNTLSTADVWCLMSDVDEIGN